DNCKSAFQQAVTAGLCAEEVLRGCCFNITDMVLHSDAIYRGAGQFVPTCRRAIYASILMAKPTLQEPVYLVEIQCPESTISGVYSVLTRCRGEVFEEEQRPGTTQVTIKAYLPVSESFGFASVLRAATGGQALSHSVFDHWQTMAGNALESRKVADIIKDVRVRKGLNAEMHGLDHYYDRL
ncbi:translation elongation factor 2, partial [Coemansia erecta]